MNHYVSPRFWILLVAFVSAALAGAYAFRGAFPENEAAKIAIGAAIGSVAVNGAILTWMVTEGVDYEA